MDSKWPQWTPTSVLDIQMTEKSTLVISETPKCSETGILAIVNPSRHSQFYRLTAVTAFIYRFIHNLHNQKLLRTGPLTNTELSEACQQLIISVQHSTYSEEFAFLLKETPKCPTLVKQL